MTTPNDAKLDRTAQNTDRELWREPHPDPPGDYYANSVHVTAQGNIGINVSGTVFVKPLRQWHVLAEANERLEASQAELRERLHEGESNWSRSVARLMREIELRDKANERLEAQLAEARELLWMNHGHTMMYGDDGEMQCAECLQGGDRLSDYKREPLPAIIRHVLKQAREQRDKLVKLLERTATVMHRWPKSALYEDIIGALAALAKDKV